MYINGKWQPALNGGEWQVKNPANGSTIKTIPFGGAEDASAAIAAAQAAFPIWREVNAFQRGLMLKKVAARIRETADENAKITTQECGKPFVEARGEWLVAADLFEWFGEEAKRGYGTVIPTGRNNKRSQVIWQPVGVVGIITAWNFPVCNLARAWAAALAAGCPIVAKPSEFTPLTAMLLTQIMEKEDFPAGVVNLVSGDAAEIGDEMMRNEQVRKVHFVGSTRVGKILMDKASATNTKLSLELGGNAPVLVFADADIKKVAMGAAAAKFRNCGQVCVSPQRFLVQESVLKNFQKILVEQVQKLRLGDGLAPETQIGPLINRKQQQHVAQVVKSAKKAGAKVLVGGNIPPELPDGSFFQPTVLGNVQADSPAFTQEIFGPVLTLTPFSTTEQAIELANATEYGLAAYIWTNDLNTAMRTAEALEFGIVGINDFTPHGTEVPFGGWKQSGQGSELGHDGLFEYMERKLISFSI